MKYKGQDWIESLPPILRRYVEAGIEFGGAASKAHYIDWSSGSNKDMFRGIIEEWVATEHEVVAAGYRPLTQDAFESWAWEKGNPIEHLVGQKLDEGEQPMFHAQATQAKFQKVLA